MSSSIVTANDNSVSISQIEFSNREVIHELFGGNIVYSANTNVGTPDDGFVLAHSELGIGSLRYPAGQSDQVYREGILENGQLPQHVVNFMDWAVESNTLVVIVTPTHPPVFDPAEIQTFVTLLMQHYSDQIEAFEVGNEHWNSMGETQYGEMADASIIAIQSGIGTLDGPEIWVQMANAAGAVTDFGPDYGGWLERLDASNQAIIAELSPEAKDAIDGVAEHYYYKSQSVAVEDQTANTNYIKIEHDLWEREFQRDLSLNITEWNVKSTNGTQLGIKAASTLLAQFQYLLELEVDTAYVWPPQHNTKNDLAGSMGAVFDVESGIVINNVLGAMFDTISSSLLGLSSLDLELQTNVEDIVTYAFGDANSYVIYLSSRSDEVTEFSFDFEHWSDMQLTSGLQIGYDVDTSDGVYFRSVEEGWVEAEFTYVNGEKYYLNEHDVGAKITTLDTLKYNDEISLKLNPFEVVELTFSKTNSTPELITATAGDDTLSTGSSAGYVSGQAGNDEIQGGTGGDVLFGDGGFDTIYGADGNDTINGGDHADSLIGGRGDDVLVGGDGFDWIHGGDGYDQIWGGGTADRLFGDDGDDWIDAGASIGSTVDASYGGAGNDTLLGNTGFDLIYGGTGDDLIDGGHQADNLYGDLGNDTLQGDDGLDRLFGGEGDDRLYGGDGSDGHFGQSGNDTMWGGEGADRFFGGTGNDYLNGGSQNDSLYGGSGFDTLEGGAGDDLLQGDFNADRFVFFEAHGHDTISDFDATNDFEILDFSQLMNFDSTSTVIENSEQVGADVVITTGSDSSIRLVDVDLSDLGVSDLLF